MTGLKIWAILKTILPTKRIAAWVVGILAAIVALVMGVSNEALKEQFCANPVVELPKIEVAPAAAPAPAPAPEAKK